VLWSEAFDADWSATAGPDGLRHVEPFGWANGFTAPERRSVSIHYDGQARRYLLIALQVALVAALVAVAWWRARATRRARPVPNRRPSP
jgi:hypothetical protein